MKKLLLFGVFAVLLSCKKNDDIDNNPSLIGKWEYRGTSCYCIPPKDTTASKPGNGNIVAFTNDTYKKYKKGMLLETGTYSTRHYDNLREQIIYDGDTTSANITFFRVENKVLTFYGTVPLAADGPEYHYEKQ